MQQKNPLQTKNVVMRDKMLQKGKCCKWQNTKFKTS